MKNSEVIKKLKTYPKDSDVVIFDHRKNLGSDDGEGASSAGIYEKIEIGPLNENDTRSIALGFVNEDYSSDGRIQVIIAD